MMYEELYLVAEETAFMNVERLREKLATLPLRAVVAIAARCARRVLPLSRTLLGYGPGAVERAILLAEDVARGLGITGVTASGAARDIERIVVVSVAQDAAAKAASSAVKAAGVL